MLVVNEFRAFDVMYVVISTGSRGSVGVCHYGLLNQPGSVVALVEGTSVHPCPFGSRTSAVWLRDRTNIWTLTEVPQRRSELFLA